MNGMMMQSQLTIDRLLIRARDQHARTELVSRMGDLGIHRYTYGDFYRRVLRLMNALRALGVKPGDRVASFAWNSYRHMELYFAVPAMGAVLHTMNIKMSPDQLEYVVRHAEDRVLVVDRSLLPMVAATRARLTPLVHLVVMDDRTVGPAARTDRGTGDESGTLDYEELLAAAAETEEFPVTSEEQAAALCYTSGTTGVLKGVLYSHRSIVLHAMGMCMADSSAISLTDSVLLIVPMFHVNGWGIPYAACLSGTKLVFPGQHVIGAPVAELLQDERITMAAGVPSVWYLLLRVLRSGTYDISRLQRILTGGAAAPMALIESYARDLGVRIQHAWGMTEMSPVGTMNRLKPFMDEWPPERKYPQLAKQGIAAALIELKLVDDDGATVPHDGKSVGELLVRGPWVTRGYYCDDGPGPLTADGWLRTGDVATVDEHGYMAITDRKKDLIKTRGEWLSSVEMENAAMGHAGILEAAVVGRPDDVRGEAVVIFVVRAAEAGEALDGPGVASYLRARFQSWQVPKQQDIHFVDVLPKTSVGKIDKRALRARLAASPATPPDLQ